MSEYEIREALADSLHSTLLPVDEIVDNIMALVASMIDNRLKELGLMDRAAEDE